MTCPTLSVIGMMRDDAQVRRWLDDVAQTDIHDAAAMHEVGRAIHTGKIPSIMMLVDHPARKVLRQGWSVWQYALKKDHPAKAWWNARA